MRLGGSFFVLVGLVGWLFFGRDPEGGTLFVLFVPIATFAVVLHELGHALVARAFGLRPFVQLHAMGGSTQLLGGHRLLPAGRRVLISLGGPLVGIIVGVVALASLFFGVPPRDTLAFRATSAFIAVTLGWGLLNLLPMLPLDGGHIVAAWLERVVGVARGRAYARFASILVAVVMAVLVLSIGAPWFSLGLLLVLAFTNWRIHLIERAWRNGERIEGEISAGYAALERRDIGQARHAAELLSGLPLDDEPRRRVLHLLAWARLLDGDIAGAQQAVDADTAPTDDLLVGWLRLASGRPDEALPALLRALEARPHAEEVADKLGEALRLSHDDRPFQHLLADDNRRNAVGETALCRAASALLEDQPERAAAIGRILFAHFPRPTAAHLVAQAMQHLGRDQAAQAWRTQPLDRT